MKLTYRLHLLFCFFSGFLLGFVLVHVPSQVVHAVDFLFGTDGNNNFIVKGRVAAGTPTPTPILIMSSGGAITNAQMSATNISSAAFGSNTGGGTYSFPGSVGIGITAPTKKLEVAGEVQFGCPSGMTDTGAGFCIDSADSTETSYGSETNTCASASKQVCSLSQFCTAYYKSISLSAGYRISDAYTYVPNSTVYFGSANFPAACYTPGQEGPNGNGNLPFRCCRYKG